MTSTGSGLSVPDWPTTYGSSMFAFPLSNMVGGIFYEHLHRMLAATVGFFMLVLAVWLRCSETRMWVRGLGYAALAAVAAQGLLGGITVLFFLPAPVSILHAVLAQTFFILTIIIAYSQSPDDREPPDDPVHDHPAVHAEFFARPTLERNTKLFAPAFSLAALVYVQLILGAVMRHTHSGLAILDFPTAGGSFIPAFDGAMLARINSARFDALLDPVTMKQVIIHFAHRLVALAVVSAAGYLTLRARSTTNRKIIRNVAVIDILLIVQVMLGALTIWSGKAPFIASFHVLTGATLLGLSVLAVLRTAPVSAVVDDGEPHSSISREQDHSDEMEVASI